MNLPEFQTKWRGGALTERPALRDRAAGRSVPFGGFRPVSPRGCDARGAAR